MTNLPEVVRSETTDQKRCKMGCDHSTRRGTPCRHYLVGEQKGKYFENARHGTCDMRNSWYTCWQHEGK